MPPAKRARNEASPSPSSEGDKPAPEPSTATDANVTDDPMWTTGDFEVITSDGVRFRVASHYLLSASAVLRDAKAMAPGGVQDAQKLVLDDSVLETAQVFRLFLDLVCRGEFDDGYFAPNARPLVMFLNKWDCAASLRHLARIVVLGAVADINGDAICPLRAFAIASIAGSAMDCQDIIRLADFDDDRYEGDEERPGVVDLYGGCSLNPAEWPLYMYNDVPPAHLWALSRAYGDVDGDSDGSEIDGVPGVRFAQVFYNRYWEAVELMRPGEGRLRGNGTEGECGIGW